jgi:hypothetical protein
MLNYNLIQKTYSMLLFIVIILSVIALSAELLPEMEAKIIVIPTLILMIILCVFQIYEKYNK